MKLSSIISSAIILTAGCSICQAQTVKSQIVENGGTGKYKAEIVSDQSLPDFTVYRPQNIKDVAKKTKLPVILYANGACANNNVEIRYALNEIVSNGYVAIAIGPYDEADFFETWRGILQRMYPETKAKVVMANGEEIKDKTPEEKAQEQENMRKMFEQMQKAQKENEGKEGADQKPQGAPFGGGAPAQGGAPFGAPQTPTTPQLIQALEWITAQNADSSSEYYKCVDLDHVIVMGQSCGGVMALAVCGDPRISTAVILNSGIGEMGMMGATVETLKSIHTPMFYLIGGPSDIAYGNSAKDFERIENVPVYMINSVDGHEGTYYEKSGGNYAKAVTMWLDWQMKGIKSQSKIFTDDDALKAFDPTWSIQRKNTK